MPQQDAWDSDGTLTRRAANDDRASLGQMLQAMHRRPARLPYVVASVAAFIWTAGGLAVGYLYRGELQALFATPRAGIAAIVGLDQRDRRAGDLLLRAGPHVPPFAGPAPGRRDHG